MPTDDVSVLIVEDNSCDAEMTLWALEKNRLTGGVHCVKDGAEALDYLFGASREAAIAGLKVILLDIKLPRVDGLEVLRKVKADAVLRRIPTVILTSSDEPRDREESYSLGVNSYVVKPLDFDRFVEAVGALCEYWLTLNRPSFK